MFVYDTHAHTAPETSGEPGCSVLWQVPTTPGSVAAVTQPLLWRRRAALSAPPRIRSGE